MASKLRLHPRGPALGKVLGDDPDLNSLYPEIAEATDLGATLRSNIRESLPVEIGRGHHSKPCCEPPVSSSAPNSYRAPSRYLDTTEKAAFLI